MSNKVVLIFTGLYLPGYKGGGPIRTIANLVENLSDEYDFKIITLDRDLGDNKPYNSVILNAWNKVGGADVYYMSPPISYNKISNLIKSTHYDFMYLNSFFSPKFTLLPLIFNKLNNNSKPVLISPKGEFSENALKIKKAKKDIFIKLASLIKLYNDLFWHASTDQEKKQILSFSEKNNIGISPDKVKVAVDLPSKQKPVNNLAVIQDKSIKICFLSRISPMKNLDYALDVLSKVDHNVTFDIYGPIEDLKYWEICLIKLKRLPNNIIYNVKGIVEPDQVCNIMSQYHMLFVPSQGENYGHVFFEALNSGTVLLTSDKTPWRNLENKKVGWDLDLSNINDFVSAINSYTNKSIAERESMSINCLRYAEKIIQSNDDLVANINLFTG